MAKSTPRFGSVEDYLASLDPTKAGTLRSVIDVILAQYPELESKISWNVPTIHRDGTYVAGVAAYANHLSFSPGSAQVIDDFTPRLREFVLLKSGFQIPVDWEVDEDLLRDLVAA